MATRTNDSRAIASLRGRLLLQRLEPPSQHGSVTGKTLVNIRPYLTAVHVHCEIAIPANLHGGLGIFVREPAEPACSADRGVRGGDLGGFAFCEELLTGFPHRLEGIDRPQDGAAAFTQRTRLPSDSFVPGGGRRLGVGKPRR